MKLLNDSVSLRTKLCCSKYRDIRIFAAFSVTGNPPVKVTDSRGWAFSFNLDYIMLLCCKVDDAGVLDVNLGNIFKGYIISRK